MRPPAQLSDRSWSPRGWDDGSHPKAACPHEYVSVPSAPSVFPDRVWEGLGGTSTWVCMRITVDVSKTPCSRVPRGRLQPRIKSRVDIRAQRRCVDEGKLAPSGQEDLGWCGRAADRAEFGDGLAGPGDRDVLPASHSCHHLTTVVANLTDGHLGPRATVLQVKQHVEQRRDSNEHNAPSQDRRSGTRCRSASPLPSTSTCGYGPSDCLMVTSRLRAVARPAAGRPGLPPRRRGWSTEPDAPTSAAPDGPVAAGERRPPGPFMARIPIGSADT